MIFSREEWHQCYSRSGLQFAGRYHYRSARRGIGLSVRHHHHHSRSKHRADLVDQNRHSMTTYGNTGSGSAATMVLNDPNIQKTGNYRVLVENRTFQGQGIQDTMTTHGDIINDGASHAHMHMDHEAVTGGMHGALGMAESQGFCSGEMGMIMYVGRINTNCRICSSLGLIICFMSFIFVPELL